MGVFLRGVECTNCRYGIVVDHAQTTSQCDRCGMLNRVEPAISQAGQRAAAVLADKAWRWDDEGLMLCYVSSFGTSPFHDLSGEWDKVKVLAEMYAGRRPAGSLDEQPATT